MYIPCMSDTGTPATKSPPPLSPAVFAILLALATGEKHGYAIMKEAAEAAGGAIKLGPGTLYGTIDRLIRDQLVEETGFTDDARRRYYRITDLGHRIFAAELFRIDNIVRAARSKALPKGVRA
jgi:DNA-binding PadR family transcriptional regulator